MTWDSSRGMAVCQAQKFFPRNLISSLGSFGCGWHSATASSRACIRQEPHPLII